MKVLVVTDFPTAMEDQYLGMARVLQYCGHQVQVSNFQENPFDVLRFGPDLVLGQTYNLSDDWVRAIQETDAECIMRGFDWGPIEQEAKKRTELTGIDYKIEYAKDNHKKWAENLWKSGQLLGVYNHYWPESLDFTMSGWKNICPVFSNPLACDLFVYMGGQEKPEFKADVAFIGSYHPYKAINLNPYLLEMQNLEFDDRPIRLRYYSTWHVPSVFYAGAIRRDDNKHALKSATICPNVSEPHSTEFGTDFIQRPMSAMLENFVISDYVEIGAKVFNNEECVFARTPKEFHEFVLHFLRYPDERLPFMRRGRKKILESHTYFDRVASLLWSAGIDYNLQINEKKKEFIDNEN